MTEYKSFRKVLKALKSPSRGLQFVERTVFSLDCLILILLIENLYCFCHQWVTGVHAYPHNHLYEKDSYLGEKLCIVAVGKRNFHSFCCQTKFQLNIELKTTDFQEKRSLNFSRTFLAPLRLRWIIEIFFEIIWSFSDKNRNSHEK